LTCTGTDHTTLSNLEHLTGHTETSLRGAGPPGPVPYDFGVSWLKPYQLLNFSYTPPQHYGEAKLSTGNTEPPKADPGFFQKVFLVFWVLCVVLLQPGGSVDMWLHPQEISKQSAQRYPSNAFKGDKCAPRKFLMPLGTHGTSYINGKLSLSCIQPS